MSILYLAEEDVAQLLDMRTAIEVVEEMFRQWGEGKANNVPRVRAKAPGVVLHSMCAAAEYLGLVGWKVYTTTKSGAQFLVGLCDAETGELEALIEADRLGQMRTAAATAVAVEWMADMEATELGLFGTGKQARTQLEAVCIARSIKRCFVYSRNEEHRQRFATEMAEQVGITVSPVDRPQEAVQDLPIVVTATNSVVPVFDGNDLKEGALVCAVGSNWLRKAEVDAHTICRADNIVCDSVEACRHEAGDFQAALEKGAFDWSRAVDLAEVVAGRAVGRNNRQSVTLFKSVGLAVEDVAVGGRVLAEARAKGFGRWMTTALTRQT
ncbi:MAG TPA: ornithine cyclodeaminase family protein [Pirellulales bacterium]|jgi:ornithine cyclodeaminase/alanine dehydrogenase-like protein (mu-crystallin family)|nr:ornithine cyclodeaminase family protein [Pirellulales bacterium]